MKRNERYILRSRIRCKVEQVPSLYYRPLCDYILSRYCPPAPQEFSEPWTPQHFYDSVHVPDPTRSIPDAIQHPEVDAQLYPFQRRTVEWLLKREGAQIDDTGKVVTSERESARDILSYSAQRDANDTIYHASHLLRTVIRTPAEVHYLHQGLRGGALTEEPGLGKTVELISLIALNRRTQGIGQSTHDAYTDSEVRISGATLIIAPASILDQWHNEIHAHAPSLQVWNYVNADRSRPNIIKELSKQDVVLTTYAVLTKEIHHANEKPVRNMRQEKRYEVTKSPLVSILWWRVCLDEAQMIEAGVSNAAIVARHIPRCNVWAVTGTPLKRDATDLMGLLIFLRYEPFCESETWNRLISHHRDLFQDIFGAICIRHTKAQIRHDLQLPVQKRVVVTVPFTAIEEQNYAQMFQDMCEDVGVDRNGAPLGGDWDPNNVAEVMRTWLVRLRQTCLHPEVGERNRRALGRRTGPLRTVEEVLEVMIEQTETNLRSEERSKLMAKVLQAHLHAFSGNPSEAADIYLAALDQASCSVSECREYHDQQKAKVRADNHRTEKEGNDEESDAEDEAQDEYKARLRASQVRLRSALEAQHICAFFAATAFFQITHDDQREKGDQDERKRFEAREAELYEKAKGIRQELLADVTKKTKTLMSKVREKANQAAPVPTVPASTTIGGIESRRIMLSIDEMRDLLDAQAQLLLKWRQSLVDLLTVSLLDQDEGVEMSGEEYEQTMKQQDESYVYLFVLRAIISDRHELISRQANFLMQHESQEAMRSAKEGEGHSPELMRSTLGARQALRSSMHSDMSLRSIASELRNMISSLRMNDSRDAEARILEKEMESLQTVIRQQTKALTALECELDIFRNTESTRLQYYKQLQAISDTVRPYAEEMSENLDREKLTKAVDTESKSAEKLAILRTKARYLMHLTTAKDNPDERRPCIICQSVFENGVLTVCAHEFCKDCITIWLASHRSCPMCKKALRSNDLHNITYKPRQVRAEEETHGSPTHTSDASTSSGPSNTNIYSSISQDALDDIKSIELRGSFGSKIDSIARHLIHLGVTDPGSKAVIFSQYRDFLQVFGKALQTFKIGYSNIADKKGIQRFQDDPNTQCFLLDAKSQSSGLNLVNATHVFLCEPLVNTAIELQAIARVHRIGQHRPTTVWQYLVSETVEETIYDISVSRRLQHVRGSGAASGSASATRSRAHTPAPDDAESKLDAANSHALQSAPLSKLLTQGKSGGEMVAQDDLWQCLFGKRSSRLEDKEVFAGLENVVGRELRADAAQTRREI